MRSVFPHRTNRFGAARAGFAALALSCSAGLWSAPAEAAPTAKELRDAKEKERAALKQALAEIVRRSPLKTARMGAYIKSLDDKSVVFSQAQDELLNPASNVKLVTAAAALVKLGPEYRFETEFLAEGEIFKDGKAKVLYVRGKGDPSISTERLYQIAGELVHAGLKEVGDLVLDESWFDAERLAPGFDQEDSDRAYMAPSGALSLNANVVGVYLRPGPRLGAKATVEVEPASEHFVVDSTATTGTKLQRRFNVVSTPEKDGQHQRLEVRGQVPGDRGSWSAWKKVDAPAFYFGHTLKALLAQRGVAVKGKVKTGAVAPSARLLYASASETLDIVLKKLNKHSSNFVAEQLIKTLGAEGRGAPGSFAKGVDVVEEFLEKEVGLPRGAYVMKNGSGLNDTNRFSAAQLARLLEYMMERFPLAPEYLSALGIAGKDGTLRYRFEGSEAVGRLRAKTGTLENVSALSGYVQSASGERFVFSLIVNDFPGRAGTVVQHIDALGAAVAATGSAQGPVGAVASLAGPATVAGPLAGIKARVRTYLAMGTQADRRNVPFLRTAFRSETDPAVRVVVADSLYQSDPQDYLSARFLLDSLNGSDAVYGRLRQVSKELGIEVPGVASVVELAATGSFDALSTLLELGRQSRGDDKAQLELASYLSEVARSAPDELLSVMKGLPSPTDRDAALGLLAKGLVQAKDDQHAFWPALKRTMGAMDGTLAAFAREAEVALSTKIAAEKAPKAAEVLLPEGTPKAGPAAPTGQSEPKSGG